MGHSSQVLSILFVASSNVLLDFVAATAGLIAVTAVSSREARYRKERVPEEHLRVILGGMLTEVGLLTILLAAFLMLLATIWWGEPRTPPLPARFRSAPVG